MNGESKAPEWPLRPYPVLGPYTHPALLAGRDAETDALRDQLQRRTPIIGLYAPSGSGKSSLLAGGLVPGLWADDWPVAFDRHPAEDGLVERLLADLGADMGATRRSPGDKSPGYIEDDALRAQGLKPRENVPGASAPKPTRRTAEGRLSNVARGFIPGCNAEYIEDFIHHLTNVHQANTTATIHRPPILILDQFEDLFREQHRRDENRDARALVGTLLAASVQRLPNLDGPVCRWILAYRHEYHGRIVRWLHNVLADASVLADARANGLDLPLPHLLLPHDLSGHERFQPWPLPLLAANEDDAAAVFLDAIQKPLQLEDNGKARYPWRFTNGHAERLANAFADARRQRPKAPLVPELQVVLAHLMNNAPDPFDTDGEPVRLAVPDDPAPLIDEALERHLKEALDKAFPTADADARLRRTRALLALRELADVHGRRDTGLSAEVLAKAIGDEGRDVLSKLATPTTRVVVAEENEDGWGYVLSHDRMAEVIVRLVDDEKAYAGLGVDEQLLRLRRLVVPQSQLFNAGGDEQATVLTAKSFRGIEENAEALLWTGGQRRWWEACRERFVRDRKRRRWRWSAATVTLLTLVILVWIEASNYFATGTRLERLLLADTRTVFGELNALIVDRVDADKILERLGQREDPFDALESGLGGVEGVQQGRAVLRVVELIEPWLLEKPREPVRVASVAWALDTVIALHPEEAERAKVLRESVVERLRQNRPVPALNTEDWIDVPAGTFMMGSPEGVGYDRERPQHEVALSAFSMMRHEVTNDEYRRSVPGHAPDEDGDLPVSTVSWYEAYAYAAWLGGRLPTAAEWEYAAQANCAHEYCLADGTAGEVTDVAWIDTNSGESAHPVMQLAPNPWGFYDMLGNVWEWTADPSAEYLTGTVRDPWSPFGGRRVLRGGGFWDSANEARVANRNWVTPVTVHENLGFRVVLPVAHPGLEGFRRFRSL